MARTTLDLDPTVLEELRERGAREGRSMGAVASDLLARQLGRPVEPERAFRWRTASMGLPLVDLEDKDAVWAALDSET